MWDGQLVMAGGSSGQLHIWNLLNDQEVQRVTGHRGMYTLLYTVSLAFPKLFPFWFVYYKYYHDLRQGTKFTIKCRTNLLKIRNVLFYFTILGHAVRKEA